MAVSFKEGDPHDSCVQGGRVTRLQCGREAQLPKPPRNVRLLNLQMLPGPPRALKEHH